MTKQERLIREEIAARMLAESLLPLGNISRWTGLDLEQVQELARGIKRLDGQWE